jgi:hypothetical protein
MTDDKTLRGPQDRSRINVEEDYEVRYWTDALDIDEPTLRGAIQAVGSSAEDVRDYLARRKAANAA